MDPTPVPAPTPTAALTPTPFPSPQDWSEGELPPEPSDLAPPIDRTAATHLYEAISFLFTGTDPVQRGVTPGAIVPTRVSLLTGQLRTADGAALVGARVEVRNHPELGTTLSRADGRFDLVVNAGGPLTLRLTKEGFLPVQRRLTPLWQRTRALEAIVLRPLDPASTPIDFSEAIQVARGSLSSDADGDRQATLLFPEGTTAWLEKVGRGARKGLDQCHHLVPKAAKAAAKARKTLKKLGIDLDDAVNGVYLGATFVRRPFIDAVQAAGLQGAYFSNPMDPWKRVFDKSPDNIDPLDVPAPETDAPGEPSPTEAPATLDRADPPPPLQDRPLTPGEQGEVALCLRNGLARLGLGPDADPLTIVQAIAEGLDRWRKAHPKPSDDDVLMASLELGPLFGEQLCRVLGWQWVAVLHGEEPLYGVVPEDRARVVYPIVWFGALTRNRRLKNNLVLVFNLVKLGRLPAADPGSYREVR